MAVNETVDAIVVGSSSWNEEIKSLAEQSNLPNLHCSGTLRIIGVTWCYIYMIYLQYHAILYIIFIL